MAPAGTTQFKISMLFMGVDQLSPEMKRMNDQVKQFKNSVNNLGTGGGGGFKFLTTLHNGLKTANKMLDDFQKKVDGLRLSGIADFFTGKEIAGSVLGPIKKAAEMQTQMITIQGATGASNQQIADIKKAIDQTTQVTRYNPNQIAGLSSILSTSGMNPMQVSELTPVVSKFAEVQQFGKHASPEEAVTQAISSAHMLGIYDPKQLDSYLDLFNKATFMTPGSTSEFFDTFKYMAPTAKAMKMSNEDILYTSALANRVGFLGSMGGTESADMILRSIPGIFGGNGQVGKDGKFKAGKQLSSMIDLGLANQNGSSVFFNDSGQFLGIKNFIEQLSASAKNVNPEQLTKDFKNMFGMQGMRLAEILSERGGEQLQTIQQQMDTMLSMTDMQEKYLHGTEGQMVKFQNNLEKFQIAVGEQLLPKFTRMVEKAGPYLDSMTNWASTHGKDIERIATATVEVGGFLMALGAAKFALGTVGSLVLPPLKLAGKALEGFGESLVLIKNSSDTSKGLSRGLPVQSIQANIVNVYGKSVNGGGGVPGSIQAGTGEIVGGGATVTKLGRSLQASGFVLRGAGSRFQAVLPISILLGAYDVATAPEGHKVEAAFKATGGVVGGWAGAEAGMAMGAGIGTFFGGPVGAAIGAGIGGIIGGFAGSTMGQKLAESAKDWFDKKTGKNETLPALKPMDRTPWIKKGPSEAQKQGASWPSVKFNNGVLDKQLALAQQKAADAQNTNYSDNSTQTLYIQMHDPKEVVDLLKDNPLKKNNFDVRTSRMTNSQ